MKVFHLRKIPFVFAFSFMLFGCATQPEKIDTAHVSPLLYEDYSCQQLLLEADRVSRRVQDLNTSPKKTADSDDTVFLSMVDVLGEIQTAVGFIILWPTMFWVEGGDGPEATEYGRLKGEYKALKKTAIAKNCPMVITAPGKQEITPAPAR